jgi:protoporphyrinogen oxidase
MSEKQYIVAGAGLAGLTAAIELTQHGNTVALYEQSRAAGGRAVTHREQGYAMNIGPHGFYRAGVMKAQFDAWGIKYSGKPPLGEGESFLIADGERHRFPAGTTSLFRSGAFSFTEKLKIGQVFATLPKATARDGESMRQWIERQNVNERVGQLISALTRLTTYCADLDLLDASGALRQIQLGLKASVLYLDGGWQTVVNGLLEKARSLGVKIVTGNGIARAESGTAELQSGERVQADGVVLAVPPRAVEEITGCTLPARVATRAACLDLGLRRLPENAGTFALGLDETTYLSVHSKYATGLAPQGRELVQLAMYLQRDAACTREELERRADLILPGWRAEVEFSRFLPEMTVVHAIPVAGRGRPDVDALNMPGVAVAGDWVGPEAMLADAAVSSGLRAARSMMTRAVGKAA